MFPTLHTFSSTHSGFSVIEPFSYAPKSLPICTQDVFSPRFSGSAESDALAQKRIEFKSLLNGGATQKQQAAQFVLKNFEGMELSDYLLHLAPKKDPDIRIGLIYALGPEFQINHQLRSDLIKELLKTRQDRWEGANNALSGTLFRTITASTNRSEQLKLVNLLDSVLVNFAQSRKPKMRIGALVGFSDLQNKDFELSNNAIEIIRQLKNDSDKDVANLANILF